MRYDACASAFYTGGSGLSPHVRTPHDPCGSCGTADKKIPIPQLVARKVLHLSVGVVLFFVPFLFKENYYPLMLGLMFLFLNTLNLMMGWFRSLLARPVEGEETAPLVPSYGSVLFPLVYMLGVLLFWYSHPWILQTALLVMAVGDSLAALVGGAYGRRRIESLTRNRKTVEGSLTMFVVSFFLIAISLLFFREDFSGGLVGESLTMLLLLSLLLALVATVVEALLSHGLDNFFIPVSVAYILYLLEVNHSVQLENFLLGGLFAFLLACFFSLRLNFSITVELPQHFFSAPPFSELEVLSGRFRFLPSICSHPCFQSLGANGRQSLIWFLRRVPKEMRGRYMQMAVLLGF